MIDRWLESRFDTKQAVGGSEVRVCCPFCNSRVGRADTKFHLYISLVKPAAHCFRCDWKGNHIGLVMNVEGCSYAEALKQLDDPVADIRAFDALNLHSPRGLVKGEEHAKVPGGFKFLWQSSSKEAIAIHRYLMLRKVPRHIVDKHFGYVPGTNRVWILVDTNWWQGRLIIPGQPKYISPPWPKSDSLWNADALVNGGKVVVCEGVFSAIAVGDSAIALCGKSMSNLQAKRIATAGLDEIVVMLDADAVDYACETARVLHSRCNAKIMIQYMASGDPALGVRGKLVNYDWRLTVENALCDIVL